MMWYKWKVKYWDSGAGNFKTAIFEGSFFDLQNMPVNLGILESDLISITKQDEEN